MARPKQFEVKDITLADRGRTRVEWADAQMPVLAAIRERFAKIGFDPTPLTADEVAATMRKTGDGLAPLIKKLNIKLD